MKSAIHSLNEKIDNLQKKGKFDMYVIKSPQFTLYFENMESLKSKPEVFVLSKGTLMGYCIVQLYDDMENKLRDPSELMILMSSGNIKVKKDVDLYNVWKIGRICYNTLIMLIRIELNLPE